MHRQRVNMHEAKTHFSKLINAVQHGESIVIAMAGKPVAELIPIQEKSKRYFGVLKGKIEVAPDFDEPLPDDVISDFEG